MADAPLMPCRRLGRSELQASVLSFGSWVTFGEQVDTGLARLGAVSVLAALTPELLDRIEEVLVGP